MRWIAMYGILLVLFFAGCYDPVALEKAEAETAKALAEQMRHEQETERLRILANASKPSYWPFLAALGCILLVSYMGHRAMLAQTAMLTGRAPTDVRLFPGSSRFEDELSKIAHKRGVRVLRDDNGDYYLEGRRVTALVGSKKQEALNG